MGEKLGNVLFGTERVDRTEFRGFIGRKQSEYDTDGNRTSERQHDGRGRYDRAYGEERREFYDSVANGDSDGSSEERQHDRFRQELHDNVGVKRPDGSSDADFARSFGNRDEHDVHDSDSSDDERYRGDSGEEHLERVGYARHRGEHVGR